MITVDLNCDMGEGCANDAELMKYISSANVACGFHAGDARTMRETVVNALKNGVAIGAHPGFPDRDGFGRNEIQLPLETVYNIVFEQITALKKICSAAGTKLNHVKPHGALYNMAARDPELASALAEAAYAIDKNLVFYGLSGSASIIEARKIGLRTASEVFADRTYGRDGSLTPRSKPNALINDVNTAVSQVLQMVKNQSVTTTDGTVVGVTADTVCIHGDGEKALEFAKRLHRELIANGVKIKMI